MSRSEEAEEDTEIAAIKRYEKEAAADPQGFQRKVVRMAMLGYWAPFAILALLAGIVGALLWLSFSAHMLSGAAIKLTFGVLIVAVVIVKAMFVKFPAPTGMKIAHGDAPRLFEKIEEIRTALNGPAINEVWLDDNLNASITQAPRFGLFGGHINRLTIGLPLANALSSDQFAAVIAHEYGHLSGSHGKTGAWIYRTRRLWTQISEEVSDNTSLFSGPFIHFVNWFAPKFGQMSFPLSRANEYEADRAAAEFAGRDAIASALLRVDVVSALLSEGFWPDIERRAARQASPNIQLHNEMASAIGRLDQWSLAENRRRLALAVATGYVDTHPSTSDRITALGAPAPPVETVKDCASRLLEPVRSKAADEFDARWRNKVAEQWKLLHENGAAALTRLDELDRLGDNASVGETLERGNIALNLVSPSAGAERFLDAARRFPASAGAWYGAGVALAQMDEKRAVDALEEAAKLDPAFALAGAQIAGRLHLAIGETEAAEIKFRQAEELGRTTALVMNKLTSLFKRDKTETAQLDVEKREMLSALLRRVPELKNASLVCKSSPDLPGVIVYHLILTPKDARNFDYQGAEKILTDMQFPGPASVHFAVENNYWMREAFDGAKVSF